MLVVQVYEDGLERLGSGSARDRVRWVSAIWCVHVHVEDLLTEANHIRDRDVLEHGPDRSSQTREGSTAGSSDTGSRTTRLERLVDTVEAQQTGYRNSRALDDAHIHDSQGGVMTLRRGTSKRLTSRTGSTLRRTASAADLDIGLDFVHHNREGIVSPIPPATSGDFSPLSRGVTPRDVAPLSPSTTLLTETDIGPSASMSGHTPAFFTAQSDIFGSAFSQHTLGRRGARRIPPSREQSHPETVTITSTRDSYLTPVSVVTATDSQATIRPVHRRRASDQSDAMSALTCQTGFLDMLEDETVIGDNHITSQSGRQGRQRGPLGSRQSLRIALPRQNTQSTNYLTATQGTEASYMTATSGRPSSSVSSRSHAVSALDRISVTSATTSGNGAKSSRQPTAMRQTQTVSIATSLSKSSRTPSFHRSSMKGPVLSSSSGTSTYSSWVSTSSSQKVRVEDIANDRNRKHA